MELIRFILFCIGFLGIINFLIRKCHFSIAISPLIAILSSTFLLYVFGLCGILEIGLYIVLAISILLGIFSFIKIGSRQEDTLIILPLVALGIILVGCFFYTRGALFCQWDEFSHWGVIFRYLMITDQLPFQTARGYHVVMANYPPFSALFEYLVAKVIGFHESNATLAIMILEYTAIFSLFPIKSWKSWDKYSLSFLVSIISAIAFGFVFQNLYVDLTIGLLFAAGIASTYFNKSDSLQNIFPTLFICIALVLLKPTGIIFAAVIIGVYWTIEFYKKHKLQQQKISTTIFRSIFSIKPLILLLIPIIVYLSWSLYSRNYPSDSVKITFSDKSVDSSDIYPAFPTEYKIDLQNEDYLLQKTKMLEKQVVRTVSIQEVLRSFTANAPYRTKLIATNFFLEISRNGSLYHISILDGFLLILLISVINSVLIYKKTAEYDFPNARLNLLLFAGLVVYLIFLYLSYIFVFNPAEAINVPSLGRYIGAYLIGWLLVNLSLSSSISFKVKRNSELDFGKYFSILLIACALLIVPMNQIIHLPPSPAPNRVLISKIVKTINSVGFSENDKIYIIQQAVDGDDGFSFHIARYLLAPIQTNFFGFKFNGETDNYEKTDIEISPADWEKLLIEHDYTYVLVLSSTDQFWNTYQSLFDTFEDKNIPQFFKVTSDGLIKIPLEFGITEEMMKVYYPQ